MADSEKYFTKMVDGQLSVATVAQTGEIIPEEDRPGDKYTTALVQTSDGPQLCVKTVDINGGGGGGGTVDQTYDPTSTNAQSGTAVAEAVQPALKNLATGSNSINILGGNTLSSTNSIAIGYNTYQRDSSVAIGYSARPSDIYSVAIGSSSVARQKCTAVGSSAETQYGSQESIAIGYFARTSAASNIQLGQGTNSTANSFQVFNYQMLDGTTGKIPMARLPGTYVHAVLQNFELFNSSTSSPTVISNPKIGQQEAVYDFNNTSNIKIDNMLSQASDLTSFDIVTACMPTGSAGTGTDGIIATLQDNDSDTAKIRLTLDTDYNLRLRVKFPSSTTNDIDVTSSSAVLAVGTKTWIKLSYSSTAGYKVLSSADGSTWTEVINSALTTAPDNAVNNIFLGRNGTSFFHGTIYMRDTYININGQTVFKAVNIGKIPMIWD